MLVLVGEEPASGEFFPPYQPPLTYSSENLRILNAMMTNSNFRISNISRCSDVRPLGNIFGVVWNQNSLEAFEQQIGENYPVILRILVF